MTRKNYLFAGADGGAERAAIAYTILGSCRLAGVDPLAYLRDVLPLMTRKIRLLDLPELLPHRWKQRRDAVAAFCEAQAGPPRPDVPPPSQHHRRDTRSTFDFAVVVAPRASTAPGR